jgi:hypothetical protein
VVYSFWHLILIPTDLVLSYLQLTKIPKVVWAVCGGNFAIKRCNQFKPLEQFNIKDAFPCMGYFTTKCLATMPPAGQRKRRCMGAFLPSKWCRELA